LDPLTSCSFSHRQGLLLLLLVLLLLLLLQHTHTCGDNCHSAFQGIGQGTVPNEWDLQPCSSRHDSLSSVIDLGAVVALPWHQQWLL
jgi:hypothetical protein